METSARQDEGRSGGGRCFLVPIFGLKRVRSEMLEWSHMSYHVLKYLQRPGREDWARGVLDQKKPQFALKVERNTATTVSVVVLQFLCQNPHSQSLTHIIHNPCKQHQTELQSSHTISCGYNNTLYRTAKSPSDYIGY